MLRRCTVGPRLVCRFERRKQNKTKSFTQKQNNFYKIDEKNKGKEGLQHSWQHCRKSVEMGYQSRWTSVEMANSRDGNRSTWYRSKWKPVEVTRLAKWLSALICLAQLHWASTQLTSVAKCQSCQWCTLLALYAGGALAVEFYMSFLDLD